MIEEEFIKKVLSGDGVDVSEVCRAEYVHHFPGAVNPEWFLHKDKYEVLFHKDGVEYIADFDLTGSLVKYKMYLEKELLPVLIRSNLERDWEIMNVVLINKRNHIIYEVIVRSSALKRVLIVVDQFGKILEERTL